MNERDYNKLVSDMGDGLGSFTQIIYQILIIIALYNFFTRVSYKNISRHKQFIILFVFLIIAIDWFIWNNFNQTVLFSAIILIYVTYNFNNFQQLDTFITQIKNDKKEHTTNTKLENSIKATEASRQAKELQDMAALTYNPPKVCKLNEPSSYEKTLTMTNKIGLVAMAPPVNQTITDSKFAETMLMALYDTPQYKAIKPNCIDSTLDNDIHMSPEKVVDINEFRNPKKEFLDNKWLSSKDYKYYDNCLHKPKAKNAICTVVEFGNELSECTDQEGTISKSQLEAISNNHLDPIY